jgi:hypothetical protein
MALSVPTTSTGGFQITTKEPWFVVAVVWIILFFLVFLTWLISKSVRPKLSMIYDMCNDYDAAYFYSFKINFGKLPPQFLKGEKSLRMDIITKGREHITRIAIPLTKAYTSKKNTMTVTFKVGRANKMPIVHYFRLDHNMFGQTVYVNYIDMRDLNENGKNNVKAKIHQQVQALFPTDKLDAYKTEQVYSVTDRDAKVGGGDTDGSRSRLTATEIVYFFGFAVQIMMMCTLHLPKPMITITKDHEWASNGFMAGAIAVCFTVFLQIFYKMTFKKYSLPFGWRSQLNLVFLIIVLLTSIGIAANYTMTIVEADNNENTPPIDRILWMEAVAVGVGVYIVIGLPVIIGFEILIQMISSKAAAPIHEDTQSMWLGVKSGLVNPGNGGSSV